MSVSEIGRDERTDRLTMGMGGPGCISGMRGRRWVSWAGRGYPVRLMAEHDGGGRGAGRGRRRRRRPDLSVRRRTTGAKARRSGEEATAGKCLVGSEVGGAERRSRALGGDSGQLCVRHLSFDPPLACESLPSPAPRPHACSPSPAAPAPSARQHSFRAPFGSFPTLCHHLFPLLSLLHLPRTSHQTPCRSVLLPVPS